MYELCDNQPRCSLCGFCIIIPWEFIIKDKTKVPVFLYDLNLLVVSLDCWREYIFCTNTWSLSFNLQQEVDVPRISVTKVSLSKQDSKSSSSSSSSSTNNGKSSNLEKSKKEAEKRPSEKVILKMTYNISSVCGKKITITFLYHICIIFIKLTFLKYPVKSILNYVLYIVVWNKMDELFKC